MQGIILLSTFRFTKQLCVIQYSDENLPILCKRRVGGRVEKKRIPGAFHELTKIKSHSSVTKKMLCYSGFCSRLHPLPSPCNDVIICNNLLDFHSTVLVAHNGFSFDFPMLFANVERCPHKQLAVSTFEIHNIHFADTLPLLRKVHNTKLHNGGGGGGRCFGQILISPAHMKINNIMTLAVEKRFVA